MHHWPLRAFAALAGVLALAACVLTPGKFTSTLTINKDRTFTFTYVGEVIAVDFGKEIAEGMKSKSGDDDDAKGEDEVKPTNAALLTIADKKADKQADKELAEKKAEFERKCRAIAAALSKEAGYRKVEYLGDGKFMVDYSISGKLTHNFVYPFNIDAEAVFPFIALELRADGKVRMKAPAFAKDASGMGSGGGGMGGMSDLGPDSKLDGTFTLDTDAEIVSQNNEAGVTTVGGRKRVTWAVTPLNRTAPMAVIGF